MIDDANFARLFGQITTFVIVGVVGWHLIKWGKAREAKKREGPGYLKGWEESKSNKKEK